MTVNACPAMVMVPVRGVVLLFASTWKPTVPLPIPDAPEVTVIHWSDVAATQTHPLVAVTSTLDEPAAAVNACDVLSRV